jgi:hypothetical protein
MMLQLNPSIPFWHPATRQPVEAILVTDYGPEHATMFTVIRRDGQVWMVPQSELRGLENATLGRPRQGVSPEQAVAL